MNWVFLVIVSYLVAAIPFGFLAVRLRTGSDLRRVGSGNPGATNALRAAGPRVAVLVLILDVGKGFVPVLLGRLAGAPDAYLAAAAVACVLGHVSSPFLGFHGGKGVATGCGALGALNPFGVLLSAVVFLVTVTTSRIVSLGSILGVASLPLLWRLPEQVGLAPLGGRAGWLASAVVCVLILLRHGGNLRRLRAGIEPRLGERRT